MRKNNRLVQGVNDADYSVTERENRKIVWICPYYQKWKDMLTRAYSDKFKQKCPTYQGVSVCEEWHSFMNFRAWMAEQDWEGKELDKDILFQGNKVYSPTTCVFVDKAVNGFMNDHGSARGKWPIGVCWHEQKQKFQSQCASPLTKKRGHIGYFNCPNQAHQAWRKRKLELAHELAAIQTDPRVAKALIDRYSKPQMAPE